MPNQAGGNNPPSNPQKQSPPKVSIAPPTIEQRVMALEAKSSAQKEESTAEQLERDIRKGEGWLIGINAALLIATIVIAVIYTKQLCEMRKSNAINRESLESVQRAFIAFKYVNTQRSLSRSLTLRESYWWFINPILENSGNTPAQSVITYGSMNGLADEPDGATFRGTNPAQDFHGGNIGPKAETSIGTTQTEEEQIFGKDFGDKFPARMPARAQPYFVWGWVAYRDVFKNPHVTEFCTKLNNVISDNQNSRSTTNRISD